MRDFLAADGGTVPVLRRDSRGEPVAASSQDVAMAVISLAAMGRGEAASELAGIALESREGGKVAPFPLPGPDASSRHASEFGKFGGHLYMLMAASCTPGGVPDDLLSDAYDLAPDGLVVWDTALKWGTFKYGEARFGEKTGEKAALMRESAVLGLTFYNEARRRRDAALMAAALRTCQVIQSAFRSDFSPVIYATSLSLGRASSVPDAEAYALAGLLSIRLRHHALTDELLEQMERGGTAHMVAQGHAVGYGRPRGAVMATAFQAAAGEHGLARATARGSAPLRVQSGPLTATFMDGREYDIASTQAAEVCRRPEFLRWTNG